MMRRAIAIWATLVLVIVVPLFAAARSPLLEWREPIYIAAGFAGIVGLVILVMQPLLIIGAIPGIQGRRAHVWIGRGLVIAVITHVVGLWIVSPPDVVDVLLFRSPTPFGVWGAVATWAVLAAALLAAVRKRLRLRFWRLGHTTATILAVVGTVIHAWLIQGTMETWSKATICLIALGIMGWVVWRRRVWRVIR